MLKELILEGQNRYFDCEICRDMQVSDSDIEKLCKRLKETAIKNTWQESEKAKIKDVTKNIFDFVGNFKRRGRKSMPDQCICTADRKDAAATWDSMRNLQGNK